MSDPVYSDAERRLFSWFNYDVLLNHFQPDHLYSLAVQSAFLHNYSGPYVDALRDAANAVLHGTTKRLTPEFDRLITRHIGDE